ncbi:MAG: hypothetical protein EOP51_27770, partial [Sphingobacteriales bacterium]
MKKLLLIVAAGFVAANAEAQTNAGSMVRVGSLERAQQNHQNDGKQHALPVRATGTANKTTGPGGSRWYNYVDYMIALDAAVENNSQFPYMWYGADMYGIYSDGAGGLVRDSIQFATYAMTFDPISLVSDFNDPFGYYGETAVWPSDPYTLDSVTVYGTYGRNANKTSIVDTLIFSFVYGNGTNATNMPGYYFTGMSGNFPGNDTVRFGAIWQNKSTNTALKNPNATTATPNVLVVKKPLTVASLNDTTAGGLNAFSVPVNMSVPAGNFVGATVTFKTGEAYTPWSDTVFLGSANPNMPFKYGMFRPLFFEQNSGGYPTYTSGNWNMGHLKFPAVDEGT